MKANEIQIGDWVYSTFSKLPCKVMYLKMHESGYTSVETTNVVGVKDMASLSPIPLTLEILEKNFHQPNEGVVWWPNDEPFYHIECLPLNGTRIILPYTQYVHQLQHALRLCGIEKEIEL